MNAELTTLARYLPADRIDDAAQLLGARSQASLAMFAAEIEDISARAAAKPIGTDEEEANSVEFLSRGLVALKELERLRKSLTAPLRAEEAAINGVFHIITDPAEALVGKRGTLERLILAYRQVKAARIGREAAEAWRRQEEAARAEAEAEARAAAAVTEADRQAALAEAEEASRRQAVALVEAPREMPRGTKTDSGSVSAREIWTFEIREPGMLPRGYLKPDDAAIRAAVAAGVREIPGVAIYLEEGLTRRVRG